MNPDPEPSFSDSSEISSLDSRAKKKKSKKKKKRRKHRKDDLSDPSLSDDSDSSEDIRYRRKQRKDKKHRKKDPIKLCANLTLPLNYMARMSNDDVSKNKDYGDSSQLANWIFDSGATCHMTPEVTDFIPG